MRLADEGDDGKWPPPTPGIVRPRRRGCPRPAGQRRQSTCTPRRLQTHRLRDRAPIVTMPPTDLF